MKTLAKTIAFILLLGIATALTTDTVNYTSTALITEGTLPPGGTFPPPPPIA